METKILFELFEPRDHADGIKKDLAPERAEIPIRELSQAQGPLDTAEKKPRRNFPFFIILGRGRIEEQLIDLVKGLGTIRQDAAHGDAVIEIR